MNNTLIIIPTYNEAGNISPLLQEIFLQLPEISVLFVDDHSTDGTNTEIKEWMTSHPDRVHIIERSGKLGLGTAYLAGFAWALERGYGRIIQMDADFSHNPIYLPRMIDILQTSDVAIGSRYVEGGGTQNWGILRRIISQFGSLYGRMILGMTHRDLTGGFNGWRAEVLKTVDLQRVRSEGYSFQIELKYRAFQQRFQLQEFPIVFADRRVGQSKMSLRIVLEAMYRVWQIRFSRY